MKRALLFLIVGMAHAAPPKPQVWTCPVVAVRGYNQNSGEWRRPVFLLDRGPTGAVSPLPTRYLPAAQAAWINLNLASDIFKGFSVTLSAGGVELNRRIDDPVRWFLLEVTSNSGTGYVRFRAKTDNGLGEVAAINVGVHQSLLIPVTPSGADWIRAYLRPSRAGMTAHLTCGD